MSPRRAAWVLLLAASCSPTAPAPTLDALEGRHARLRAQFEAVARREAAVAQAVGDGGDLIVAIPSRLMADLIERVAGAYLGRVAIHLKPFSAGAQGDLKTGTPLGEVKVGHWTVDVAVDRLRGILRGHKPTVRFATGNVLNVSLPVLLEEGTGAAHFRFTWVSMGLTSVVCRSFSLERELEGRVLPEEYGLAGSFVLQEADGRMSAQPVFPSRRILLHLDFTPRSWDEVERALDTQDSFLKCGLLLKPKEIVQRLRQLGAEGIGVSLPDVLFRTVALPTGFQQSITVGDRVIGLRVRAGQLRVTPETLWSSASVRPLPETTVDPPTAAPP